MVLLADWPPVLSPPIHHHPPQFTVRFGRQFVCGLCLLRDALESEVPLKIHEGRKSLADNGNPAMDGRFIQWLDANRGLRAPEPDQSLFDFRLARKQYSVEPNRKSSPVTFALWDMFGKQPKLARPLLSLLLGATEEEVARAQDMSIYGLRSTATKAIRMAVKYLR